MTTMPTRAVGRSPLRAPAIGIGCIPFGVAVDDAMAARIVDVAIERGANWFDTANSYGRGTSEEVLGRAIAGRRDRVLVATKFGERSGPDPLDGGATRAAVVKACEGSLRRLRTDRIDLYQLHWPDRSTPIEETLRALDDLVRAGKVRHVGCSNLYEWEICEAVMLARHEGLPVFACTQDHYNLLYRDIEKRMEPFLLRHGVGLIPYFPLAGGMLAHARGRSSAPPSGSGQASNANAPAWQSPRNAAVQEKLAAFARERGWLLPQLSLAWLLTRPAVCTVIAGVDSVDHLLQNLAGLDVRLTGEDLVEIDRVTLVDEDRTMAPVFRALEPERFHEFETLQAARRRGMRPGRF